MRRRKKPEGIFEKSARQYCESVERYLLNVFVLKRFAPYHVQDQFFRGIYVLYRPARFFIFDDHCKFLRTLDSIVRHNVSGRARVALDASRQKRQL